MTKRKISLNDNVTRGNGVAVRHRTSLTKLLLLVIAALFAISPARGAQQSAQSSVNKMVAAIKKHPAMDFVFTLWQNDNSYAGTMSAEGKMFYLSTPGLKIWYNGKTQWAYSSDTGEVNLTEPTAAELAESNPLAILSGISANFSPRRLKAPAGLEKIELTPKNHKGNIKSAIVTLNASTFLPQEITLNSTDGQSVTVKISSAKGTKAKGEAFYKFNPKLFPGVEVIDLR